MCLKNVVACLVFVVPLVTCTYAVENTQELCNGDCTSENNINHLCISQKIYRKEHETVELQCINGEDTRQCHWYRSDCEEEHSGSCKWSVWHELNPSNVIGKGCRIKQTVSALQHSIYKCDSLPKEGHHVCQAFLVVSTVAPERPHLIGGVDERIQLDDASTSSALICKAEGGQPPVRTFQWFIGGRDFSSMAILKRDGFSEINVTRIKDLYKYNNKKVMCRIEHPSRPGFMDDNATLSITYKPRLVELEETYSAREDSALSVPLLVAANPALQSISVKFSLGTSSFNLGLKEGITHSGVTFRLVKIKTFPANRNEYTRYKLKISSVSEKVAGTEFLVIMNNRKGEQYKVEESFQVVFDSSLSPLHIGLIAFAAIVILLAIIIIIVCFKKRRYQCGKKNGWSAWGRHDIDNNCELQGNTNRSLEETRRGDHLPNGVHEDDVMLKNTTCQNGGYSRKNSRNHSKRKDDDQTGCDTFLECCIG